jgi:hypothetical protein
MISWLDCEAPGKVISKSARTETSFSLAAALKIPRSLPIIVVSQRKMLIAGKSLGCQLLFIGGLLSVDCGARLAPLFSLACKSPARQTPAFYISLSTTMLSRRSNLGRTLAPVLTLIFIFIVCARLLLFQLKDASKVIRAEYKLGETSFASCFSR